MKKINLKQLAIMGIASGALLASQSANACPCQYHGGGSYAGMHGCNSSNCGARSSCNNNNGSKSHCGAKSHCASKSSCGGVQGCNSNSGCNGKNGHQNDNARVNRNHQSQFLKPSYPEYYNSSDTALVPRNKRPHDRNGKNSTNKR